MSAEDLLLPINMEYCQLP